MSHLHTIATIGVFLFFSGGCVALWKIRDHRNDLTLVDAHDTWGDIEARIAGEV